MRRDNIAMYLRRQKKRRILRVIKRYSEERVIQYPPVNGTHIKFCEIMLRSTFGVLMENVWLEFPKQKIIQSSGHRHLLLNYLALSKNPRYRQFYFTANIVLRKHILSQHLNKLKANAHRMRAYRVRQANRKLAVCLREMASQCR